MKNNCLIPSRLKCKANYFILGLNQRPKPN